MLLLVSIAWGINLAAGMRLGVKSAPKENCERRTSAFGKLVFYSVTIGLMMLPSIVTALVLGLSTALPVGWLVVAAMAVTVKLYEQASRGDAGANFPSDEDLTT